MEGQERQAKIKATNKSKHKKTEPKKCSRKDYKQKILEWTGIDCCKIYMNFFANFFRLKYLRYKLNKG